MKNSIFTLKSISIIFFFFISLSISAQQTDYVSKTINGKITYLNAPLPNVNIVIKGTSKGTKTNTKGNYSILAKIGDVLQYSYVGFKTVSIIVEDVTTVLNIEMATMVNELEEAVVIAEGKKYHMTETEKLRGKPFKTAVGMFRPGSIASNVTYFDDKDNLGRYNSFSDAWGNIYAYSGRGLPSIWDVDGIIHYNEPYIDLSQIIDIHVIRSRIGTMRWGGPVIIVRTKYGNSEFRETRLKDSIAKYTNKNYYNEDAVAVQNNMTFFKTIKGKITYLNAPLPNVNIIIKKTSKGTKTNTKGNYSIQAKIGDIVQYSYIGFNTVSILIEDVTSILNIEMIQKVNELDEALVKARIKPSKVSELENKLDVDLITPFGTFNPKKSGFDIKYIAGKDINLASLSLPSALGGKVAGLTVVGTYPNEQLIMSGIPPKPVTYVLDGMTFSELPPINLNSIVDIYIIKIKKIIVIRTTMSPAILEEKRKKTVEQYQNQNYYNDDAITTSTETTLSSNRISTQNNTYLQKIISGNITYIDVPLANVNIIVVGKTIGMQTNSKGNYTIKARVGDIVQYSHLGFATVSIIIEDVTEILDIEMVLKANELDEVTVITDGKLSEVLERSKKANETFETSRGKFNPKNAGYAVGFVDGNELSNTYSNLREALLGKISGFQIKNEKGYMRGNNMSINQDSPVAWEVDGVFTTDEPTNLDLSQIKDIHALKTLAATTKYGTLGAGGVIVISTNYGSFNTKEAKAKKTAEQYTNKNYYSNDASIVNLESLNSNSFTDALEAFKNKHKAFNYYNQKLKNQIKDYSIHISIAQKFLSFYNDTKVASFVLNELAIKYHKNPEILKAIAYQLQALSLKRETITIYESVYKLRPKYAQSYRDLANAYVENDQYKKAWRLYMSYLLQGNDVSGEGIGQTLYNEMEFLYYNRSFQTEIKETFIPKSEDLFDFRDDVRIVFEWNTSEAEFDLEFVNQEKRAYMFEHSLAANQDLITNEKQKGYSSKEFFIDDIGEGEWLVNITYKGNKTPQPTYFKVTQYYNWGEANQTKEIAIYKFQNEREKIQIIRLNKQLLVASN